VICSAGRPAGAIKPEKTDCFCEEQLGFGTAKAVIASRGCDGACIHAMGSLAGADGWSITNVAAFSIVRRT
jgi:hypothetical protein